MSTTSIRLWKRPPTDTVVVPVSSNRLIEETIERSETNRSDILIALIQLANNARHRTNHLWSNTKSRVSDIMNWDGPTS